MEENHLPLKPEKQNANNNSSKSYVQTPLGFIMWKCYQCSLFFKNESSAKIHENISKHHVKKIIF